MKNNFKYIMFILIAIIALYFTKVNYSDHSISKSIAACIIAQKKSKNLSNEEAKKFCENEINKKLNK
tara:strand:+ start:573 stop:773 length:201 start_codon:yes stop_codon:yes gene_type:complete